MDGQRIYLAPDASLVVNVTADPEVARSSLGSAYTCHVTNGMTSDIRHVRLGDDVITGVADWPTLSWMSVNSLTGSCKFGCVFNEGVQCPSQGKTTYFASQEILAGVRIRG